MNLENAYYKLQEISGQLNSNNENHYNLNQSLLSATPEPEASETTKGVEPPEGMLSNIHKVIWRIEKEINFQRYNISRTNELINHPTINAEVKGH